MPPVLQGLQGRRVGLAALLEAVSHLQNCHSFLKSCSKASSLASEPHNPLFLLFSCPFPLYHPRMACGRLE